MNKKKNKKKYILLLLMLSLITTSKVHATCSQEMKNEFNRIRNQYKITTTYDASTKTYTMRIEEGDRNKFKYVFAMEYDYKNYKQINDKVAEISGLKPGMTFDVTIMGQSNDCRDSVRVDYINLKKNNEYYGDPLCEGIEEFVLCQEMYDKDIDRETFESRINIYKESKKEKLEQEEIKRKEENKNINKISLYIQENLTQVIIIIIFIILLLITIIVIITSSVKSRRLE